MTVCRYFLQNTCRFGDNCRFEHPRGGGGGARQNLFGGGGAGNTNWQGGGADNTNWQGGGQKVTFRDSFGTGGNQFKWTANQNQQQTATATTGQTITPLDLVNALPREMDVWEKSKMWPFSCMSCEKDLPCVPDFYDMSVEEMRLEAYQALAVNNIQAYAQKFQSLVAEFQNKRMQFKNMNMDQKRQLATFIEEARKKKNNPTASTLNSTTSNQGGQSLFGGNSSTGQTSTNLFGQSGSTPSTGLFGNSASSSSFAGNSPSMGSTFGGNTSALGSAFANTVSQPTGLFGKPPQSTSSPFGGQAQQSQSTGLFGNAQKPSLFGGNQMSGSTSKPGGLFGQGTSQPSTGLFSSSGSSFANPTASSGVFGNAASTAPSTSVFGASSIASTNTPTNTSGLFGSAGAASTPTTGLFGKGQPTPGLFGKPANPTAASNIPSVFDQSGAFQPASASSQQSGTAFGGTAVVVQQNANSSKSLLHSAMQDLTVQDLEAFKAPAFTLGKIPLMPPPVELLNI